MKARLNAKKQNINEALSVQPKRTKNPDWEKKWNQKLAAFDENESRTQTIHACMYSVHTHNGRKKNRHSVTHIQNAVYTQSIFICSIFIFNHLSAFGLTIHIFVYLFARKPAHDAESEFASKLTSESSTLTRTLIASSH